MKNKLITGFTFVLIIAPYQAYASSTAYSSFSQFEYSLSSFSGLSPSITWGNENDYGVYSWANTDSLGNTNYGISTSVNNGILQNTSSSTSGPIGSAASLITGSGYDSALSFSSTGTSDGGQTLWNGGMYGTGVIVYSMPFTLSAWSSVTFSGVASAATYLTKGSDATTQSFEYAGANVWFGVEGPSPTSLYGWQSDSEVLGNRAGYTMNGQTFDTLLYLGASRSLTSTLSLNFNNLSDTPLTGELHMMVETYGFSSVNAPANPVPEPSATLLFGIGLVGFTGVARRKRN